MSGVYLRRRGTQKKRNNVFVDIVPTFTTPTLSTNISPRGRYLRLEWDVSSIYNDYASLSADDIIPVFKNKSGDKITPIIGSGVLNASVGSPVSASYDGGITLYSSTGEIVKPSCCFIGTGYNTNTGTYYLNIGQTANLSSPGTMSDIEQLLSNGGFLASNARIIIARKIDHEVDGELSIVTDTKSSALREIAYRYASKAAIEAIQPQSERRCGFIWVPVLKSKSTGIKRHLLGNIVSLSTITSSARIRPTATNVGSSNVNSSITLSVGGDNMIIRSFMQAQAATGTAIAEMYPVYTITPSLPINPMYYLTPTDLPTLLDLYDMQVDVIGNLETMEVITAA